MAPNIDYHSLSSHVEVVMKNEPNNMYAPPKADAESSDQKDWFDSWAVVRSTALLTILCFISCAIFGLITRMLGFTIAVWCWITSGILAMNAMRIVLHAMLKSPPRHDVRLLIAFASIVLWLLLQTFHADLQRTMFGEWLYGGFSIQMSGVFSIFGVIIGAAYYIMQRSKNTTPTP